MGDAVKAPPLSEEGRFAAALMLRKLQLGEPLPASHSLPIPSVGERCHELHLSDGNTEWRIIHRIDPDAVLLLEIFNTTGDPTPRHVIETCQWRIKRYDQQRKRKGL